MQIRAIKTRIFKERENLLNFILRYIEVKEKSILVITSKIVALAEGRVVSSWTDKEKLVKKESDVYLNAKTWFTIKDGMVMPKAGIDESNGDGKLILLPKDSYKSAELVQKALKQKLKLKNLGVIITDSGFVPMRAGAVGMAVGYAGFKGVKNYVGKKDIFGRPLKVSSTNVADALATAAVFCMGEGNEMQPLALITGAKIEFTNNLNKKELRINPKKDIYAPLFNKLN
jgi:dihydrofolate synthase / folylpolyglutamate synthase